MKKILFIVTKSENGGAQKWVKEQIEICKNDFEVFLATDENGWLSKNVTVKDKLLDFQIHKRFSIKYLSNLIKFIKKNNINLIVASSANAGIYARLSKLYNRKLKVIYVSHGWSSVYNGGRLTFLYTFVEKQLSKLTDSVLCISESDYERAKNIINIKSNRLKLITNKIFPMEEKVYRNDNKIKILTVARLRYPKRVDLLIQSLKDLNIELYVVGDGPLMSSLEIYQEKSNIYFMGEIDEFSDFKNYDIFALISESEGLPLSAIEAMSAGLPLVLSNVGGCSELIEDNGVLVQNNIEEIYSGVLNSIENIENYSIKSKLLFDKKFNLNNLKNEYIKYYDKI